MFQEFKKFLIKGNAVDMAVGFIFGAAFATVVKSFVTNIVMPPIGKITGGVDFSQLFLSLDGTTYQSLQELDTAWAPAIKYGLFINDFISFLILGFILFVAIKAINTLANKEEEKKPAKAAELVVLEEIRDALAKKK